VRKLFGNCGAAALAVLALALAGAGTAAAAAPEASPAPLASASTATTGTGGKAPDSVALEACTTAATQMERSATFAAEMTLVPGSVRMEMRLELLEKTGKQVDYHAVTAPGLGAWRAAAPGVRVYRYVKQVTNLAAPAAYRAEVRFRWLGAHGRLVKSAARRSASCAQLLPSETGATEAAPQSAAPLPAA
jgi:hypothetical protein